MFGIKDFYYSITQDLLNKALNFATEYIYISKCDIDVIHHARNSLLFHGSHTWVKKQGGLFDVSMGAYDGGEVPELVDTYTLNLLCKKYNKNNFRLYRDDTEIDSFEKSKWIAIRTGKEAHLKNI